jgi:hypothetical protein
MGCFYFLFALLAPRVLMAMIFLFTHWFAQAYETVFWPLMGFIFMPFTTLAYMAAMLNNGYHVDGFWLVLVVLAVLADLGHNGGGARAVRRRHFIYVQKIEQE